VSEMTSKNDLHSEETDEDEDGLPDGNLDFPSDDEDDEDEDDDTDTDFD